MRKTIIIFITIIISIMVYNEQKEDTIIIPDTAIRLRIIPNSNSIVDQNIKVKVKQYLENNTYQLLKNEINIDNARKIIKENIPEIKKNIDKIFEANNYESQYKVEYGNNYFPEKKYRGIKYDEGYYESIVVSIGEAKGDNWWCVLFPNLCLADINKLNDVEYNFWVLETIKKYSKK